MNYEGGKAPFTDVYGSAQYSDASGMYHTSTRDKERVMREYNFYPAGDKVHGARNEHRLTRTTYSEGKQTSRRTVSEGV
jgi:hypothetical protein